LRSNIQTEEIARSHLRDVITTIQGHSVECKWFVSSTQLISLLYIKKEDYYRELYSLRNANFNPAKLTGFHEEECMYLCLLLEKILRLGDVEEEFIKAGIYFNEKSLSILREKFIECLSELLSKHKVDKDLLMILSSATINFDDAFDTYFFDKFNMDRIIDFTIESFISNYSIDPFFGGEIFLKKFLEDQVQYKKIPFAQITEEYRERYYYELFGRLRKSQNTPKLSKEIRQLLAYFNLEEGTDKKKLNTRYKELLKIYHPDVNKSGLEKTKEIIKNYKKLHALLEV
jgi:hypothetical protein